jgi:preprotein translocase subunit YajC
LKRSQHPPIVLWPSIAYQSIRHRGPFPAAAPRISGVRLSEQLRGLMPMLIATAYAQGTGLPNFLDSQSALQFLPLVLIFVVFYFLLIRPQQKKAKDHRATLDALRRGDRVVTGGGIIGTIVRVDSPEEVSIDIAEGVRVRVVRSTITNVLAKPDPAAAREAARQREQARAKAETKD